MVVSYHSPPRCTSIRRSIAPRLLDTGTAVLSSVPCANDVIYDKGPRPLPQSLLRYFGDSRAQAESTYIQYYY